LTNPARLTSPVIDHHLELKIAFFTLCTGEVFERAPAHRQGTPQDALNGEQELFEALRGELARR
jgi:hypothetical protein